MSVAVAESEKKLGYWTREQLEAMNRAALLKLTMHHPDQAPREIREMLDRIRKAATRPAFNQEDANRILQDFLANLPESDGNEDEEPFKVERSQVETAKAIRHAVAARYNITVNDIDAACRERYLARARQEAMYLVARDCPMLSYPRIGRMFGNRDHTTVLHAIKCHAERNNLPRVRCGPAGAAA